MTTANQAGGFLKTLTITRDNSSESVLILKNKFLKKTNNYVLQLTKFITNITPQLNLIDEVMFKILPKGGVGEAYPKAFSGGWNPSYSEFRPAPYRSVADLVVQMQYFFHRFGHIARSIGDGDIPGDIFVGNDQFPFVRNNVDPLPLLAGGYNFQDNGWSQWGDDGRLVNIKLKANGCFGIHFTAEFASNFYVEVGPETQIKTGLGERLFVVQVGGVPNTAEGAELFDPDLFVPTFNHPKAVQTDYTFYTGNTLKSFDDRLSIDIIATFPLSNKFHVFNGEEQHEFILGRFPVADFQRFETEIKSNESEVTDEVTLFEDVNVGLEDLCRSNPNIESIFMLPGDIQQVNLQLFTRYFQDGVIRRKSTDMANGFWSCKLLFSKKA